MTKGDPCRPALGGMDTILVHPHHPTHLVPPPPSTHSRIPLRGVGLTGERGAVGPSPVHRPYGPRSFIFRPPRLHNSPTRRDRGRGQRCSDLSFPVHRDGKGCNNFSPSHPLSIQGGRALGPPSLLGGGRSCETEDERDSHPKSGPGAGPVILSPGCWRGGVISAPPSP